MKYLEIFELNTEKSKFLKKYNNKKILNDIQ